MTDSLRVRPVVGFCVLAVICAVICSGLLGCSGCGKNGVKPKDNAARPNGNTSPENGGKSNGNTSPENGSKSNGNTSPENGSKSNGNTSPENGSSRSKKLIVVLVAGSDRPAVVDPGDATAILWRAYRCNDFDCTGKPFIEGYPFLFILKDPSQVIQNGEVVSSDKPEEPTSPEQKCPACSLTTIEPYVSQGTKNRIAKLDKEIALYRKDKRDARRERRPQNPNLRSPAEISKEIDRIPKVYLKEV